MPGPIDDEINRIIQHDKNGNYLVQWEGYENRKQWIYKEDISPDALEEYHRERGDGIWLNSRIDKNKIIENDNSKNMSQDNDNNKLQVNSNNNSDNNSQLQIDRNSNTINKQQETRKNNNIGFNNKFININNNSNAISIIAPKPNYNQALENRDNNNISVRKVNKNYQNSYVPNYSSSHVPDYRKNKYRKKTRFSGKYKIDDSI
ncbi:hypothetical protein CYY_009915 [Polysphondylium violaceum]|uniref:Chromo domain-containing protein n=1 Tax=Polysphondylium violaceum TaxID=133409 RepID=A0A8J4PKW0_9MYCE|nr:hypothetical protein CYY_009915 [Polysphondylium violaceum]